MSTTALHFPQLPYYLTVLQDYDEERDAISIRVLSKVHVNKEIKLPMSYSKGFVETYPSRYEGEILRSVVSRYGLTWESRYV